MKKNNRGFTLLELIIVIAILGIAAGLLGASVSTASAAKQKQCATSINSYISMCRTRCLSRTGDPYIIIRRDGVNGTVVGEYYEKGTMLEVETLGDKSVLVSYKKGADSIAGAEALEDAPLIVSFSRGDGALEPPEQDVWIYIGKYKIRIYALTGAHRFE